MACAKLLDSLQKLRISVHKPPQFGARHGEAALTPTQAAFFSVLLCGMLEAGIPLVSLCFVTARTSSFLATTCVSMSLTFG